MTVLSFALAIAGGLMFVLLGVYCWRNRPYRGPGADLEAQDEMAMRVSTYVDRIHDMGADIGADDRSLVRFKRPSS